MGKFSHFWRRLRTCVPSLQSVKFPPRLYAANAPFILTRRRSLRCRCNACGPAANCLGQSGQVGSAVCLSGPLGAPQLKKYALNPPSFPPLLHPPPPTRKEKLLRSLSFDIIIPLSPGSADVCLYESSLRMLPWSASVSSRRRKKEIRSVRAVEIYASLSASVLSLNCHRCLTDEAQM